jgi:hypothetical protein
VTRSGNEEEPDGIAWFAQVAGDQFARQGKIEIVAAHRKVLKQSDRH